MVCGSGKRTGWTILIVAAATVALGMPSPADAQWSTETIASTAGALGDAQLVFDARGNGSAWWQGFQQHASPQRYTALVVRDSASSTWSAPTRLAGITWGNAQIAAFATQRTLLIATQTSSLGAFNRARRRLVYAFGHTGERFGALRTIDENVSDVDSATNPAGDTIVVYDTTPNGQVRIAERSAGRSFGAPHPINAGIGAVAISPRGDRVIAWWGRAGVFARIKRAGHNWGSVLLAAPGSPVTNGQVRAVFTPSGRVVLAWQTIDAREGHPITYAAGFAVRDRSGGWKHFALGRGSLPASGNLTSTTAPAVPIVDTAGQAYVAWTGVQGTTSAVRFAQVTSAGPRHSIILSAATPAAELGSAAAGPGGALAATWSAPSLTDPSHATAVYAVVRRSGAFQPIQQLTPSGVVGSADSTVAFQPLTGQAVVTWGAIQAGHSSVRVSVDAP